MLQKIKSGSFYLFILVFTFQSQHSIGQRGGNVTNSDLVLNSTNFINNESVRGPREIRVTKFLNLQSLKEDDWGQDAKFLKSLNDNPLKSTEKEQSDDEEDSWSSSTSEESDYFTGATIGTTSKPNSNGSSANVLRKKIKLTKSDKAKLVKPRDAQNSNNFYDKSDAKVKRKNSSGQIVSEAGSNTKQLHQHQQNRPKHIGKKVKAESLTNTEDGATRKKPFAIAPDHNLYIAGIPGFNKKLPTKPKKEPIVNFTKIEEPKPVNRTKKPYKVERASDAVDPNVYSFFQFRSPESIGLLWTQRAKFNGIVGRKYEDLEGLDEDHLDPSNLYDWEFKRYDRACLYVEYNANKEQYNSSQVSEQITRVVDNQNERLARKFLDWQFINKEDHETIALKGEGENHPRYLTYKFLTMTMEIFRDTICRNATPYASTPEVKHFAPVSAPMKAAANKKYLDTKLLPKIFIDDLYRLFLTLRDITLPKGVPDYPTKKDEENIYGILENCLKREPIQWFSHTCADQVLSYDDPNNYACTPIIEYDFNNKEYDPILDGMWHMFTAVHAFCYDEFNKVSTRFWHKYSMILVNSFTERMRTRWKAQIADPTFYVRLLGPDHKTHLETMNRCMFASTLRSGAPYLLPRFLSSSPLAFGKEKVTAKGTSDSRVK